MKIDILLLGSGALGCEWLDVFDRNESIGDVYLVEPSRDSVKKAIQRSKKIVRMFENLDKVSSEVLSKVYLCVDSSPPDYHLQNAQYLISRDVNLLQEKSLLTDSEDFGLAEKVIGSRKVKYGINYTYRFTDWYKTLQAIIKKEGIKSIDLKLLLCEHPDSFRLGMRQPLLFEYLIHHINIINSLYDINYQQVSGKFFDDKFTNQYEGQTSAIFKVKDKVNLKVNASIAADSYTTKWEGNWIIETEKNSYKYDSTNSELYQLSTNKLLIKEPSNWLDRLDRSFKAFIRSIEDNTTEPMSIEEHLRDLKCIFKIKSSLEA